MGAHDSNQEVNLGEIVFPFPEAHMLENGVDIPAAVQFIGAVVTHAEAGHPTEEVLVRFRQLPDKVFARNVALYAFGITKDEAFRGFVDKLDYEGVTEMSQESQQALAIYFGLARSSADASSVKMEVRREVTEEDVDQVRAEVWEALSPLRAEVQNADSLQEQTDAKTRYDEEITRSLHKLADVDDFAVALDLSTGTLTKNGKLAAQVQYDSLVYQRIKRIQSMTELTELRELSLSTFTPYGQYAAKGAYDQAVMSAMEGMRGEVDLDAARNLAGSCLEAYGKAQASSIHDKLLLSIVEQALAAGSYDRAVLLSTRAMTDNGAAQIQLKFRRAA